MPKTALLILCTLGSSAAAAARLDVCLPADLDGALPKQSSDDVRFATFNAFLNRNAPGELIADLGDPGNPQIAAVAEIVQRVRPDVLLINEFDFDAAGEAVALFKGNFLEVSQNGQQAIDYPYVFNAPSNTGVGSGLDFDNDGATDGPGDAFGFGSFAGQYGMVLLSRHPIAWFASRTFRQFRWRDMPGALLPDDPATPARGDWYSDKELDVFRLSSKSHWDVPVFVGGTLVHVLAAHPTPPVFDGPEDFNGRRNHDEIRFWADYVEGGHAAHYIRDDRGRRGGLGDRPFVILGDYNADPLDGDSTNEAIQQLLAHPRIDERLAPGSLGGFEDAGLEGALNDGQRGNAALDTGDFNPGGPGNLRVDYVLPSLQGLRARCGGVFWPSRADASRYLVGDGFPVVSSDHHLVWLDVSVVEFDHGKHHGRRDKN